MLVSTSVRIAIRIARMMPPGGSWNVALDALFCGGSTVRGRGPRRGIAAHESDAERLTPVSGPTHGLHDLAGVDGGDTTSNVSFARGRVRSRELARVRSSASAQPHPSSDPNPRVVAGLPGL